MMNTVESVARDAREAALELAALDTATRNRALEAVRAALVEHRDAILRANAEDKEDAARLVETGEMPQALFKRLDVEGVKFDTILAGIDDVVKLPDPVGRVGYATQLDEGLDLRRVSCPIGVIGVIFEARPEAAVQISALTLKTANAVILKGGREAERTNRALVAAIREGLASSAGAPHGVPQNAVQLIATREEVRDMLELDRWIDLIIPRGSNELVRSIQESTRIPVLGHADGLCAVYLDAAADLEIAARVVLDSKTDYPAACNAVETLLVHEGALAGVLPEVGRRLRAAGVELRADGPARDLLASSRVDGVKAASEEDFDTEFLDLVLAIKTVSGVDEAIEHINRHGSHHTDTIVTDDPAAAEEFLQRVDSAGVYHNASTRFADGFRYGFGAEVGISTNKTHARGPVGVEGLVIYKFQLRGRGQIAAEYGPGKKAFLHRPLPDGSR